MFGILVNGVERTSNLDVFATAGCETAHLESYNLKPNSSGEFEIILKRQKENPMISYIEIFELVSGTLPAPPPTRSPVPPPTRAPVPRPTPSPVPAPASFGVNGFILVDSDRNKDLPGALSCKPACVGQASKFNIRATTFGGNQIKGVSLSMNGPVHKARTEEMAPYALFGDRNGNYNGTAFPSGTYTVTAFAFNWNGDVSRNYTMTFDTGSTQTVSSALLLPPTPPKTSTVVRRVDAGGSGDDSSIVSGIPSFQFGNTQTPFIANTDEKITFRAIRYGADFTYTLDGFSPKTMYEVVFGFEEPRDPYCNSGGNRIFNVLVNGSMVIEKVDVFEAAGGY